MVFGNSTHAAKTLIATVAAAMIAMAPALAKTVSYNKSAQSGKTQRIDSYFGWNDDCSFKTIDVSIIGKPANGTVTPKFENARITGAQVGSAGKCLGKKTRALAVFYRSSKGFKGRDKFTVRMKVPGLPPVDFVYTVNVR